MQHLNTFDFGFLCGVASVVFVAIALILFYSKPVKRQIEEDERERFRFRRNQFNYMDRQLPNAKDYSYDSR